MTGLTNKVQETLNYLQGAGIGAVDFGLILGSGLGELAEEIENPVRVPYTEIPHFPVSTVVGHAGQLVYGTLAGKRVLAMQGRFHARSDVSCAGNASFKSSFANCDQCLWGRE